MDSNEKVSIPGSTIRWTFTDGPVKGRTFEHVFGENGTVTFRAVEAEGAAAPPKGDSKETGTRYTAFQVSDDVQTVSYKSSNGYTLTVVLNARSGELYGFASNEKEWHPLRGTFEVMGPVRRGA